MTDLLSPPATLAFVGLGTMGGPMAANLLRAGFRLRVHTRTRARATPLLEAGATWADTPAEAAHGADALLTCLPDAPDVATVLFGEAGAIQGLRAGAVAADFSTIAASAARAHAAMAAAAGFRLLDAPVSGGPGGARDATLTVFVGGDEAALARPRPVLDAVGRMVTHLGPAGAGQVGKACNQSVVGATMVAVAEAMILAERAGLDAEALRGALLGGSSRSFVMENHARRMIARGFDPAGFRAELMRKDLCAAEATAGAHGAPHGAATRARTLLDRLAGSGRGGLDSSAVFLALEEGGT